MNWQTTDHDYRLIEGTLILARIYRVANMFRADIYPPEKPPKTTTEATLTQAQKWAEEMLRRVA